MSCLIPVKPVFKLFLTTSHGRGPTFSLGIIKSYDSRQLNKIFPNFHTVTPTAFHLSFKIHLRAGNSCPRYEWNLNHPLLLFILRLQDIDFVRSLNFMFTKSTVFFFSPVSRDLTHLNAFSFTKIKNTFYNHSGIQATLKSIIFTFYPRNSSQKYWGSQQKKGPDQHNTSILQANPCNVAPVRFSPLTGDVSET